MAHHYDEDPKTGPAEAFRHNMDKPHTGEMKIVLIKEFTFEASHVLPKHPGKCSKLHGHSWKLKIGLKGYVNPETGFVVDYYDLKQCVQQHILDKVDHAHLGCDSVEMLGTGTVASAVLGDNFYPSSENLVKAFVRILQPLVKELAPPAQEVELTYVELNETCTSAAIWRKY